MSNKEVIIYIALKAAHKNCLEWLQKNVNGVDADEWRDTKSDLATIDWLLDAFENGKIKLVEVEE